MYALLIVFSFIMVCTPIISIYIIIICIALKDISIKPGIILIILSVLVCIGGFLLNMSLKHLNPDIFVSI